MINPKLFLKDQQTPIVLPVQPVSGIGALCGVAVIITRRHSDGSDEESGPRFPGFWLACTCCFP